MDKEALIWERNTIKNNMLFWLNYYWAGPQGDIYDAICTLIKNNGNIMEAMMADQEAIMAAEKLAIDFLKLKKKVWEWHDIMKNCLGNGDIEAWGRCLGILMEIRDFGEEKK